MCLFICRFVSLRVTDISAEQIFELTTLALLMSFSFSFSLLKSVDLPHFGSYDLGKQLEDNRSTFLIFHS